MGGTLVGGKAAAETNKKRHGDDFYRKIGSKGGKALSSHPKGFAANRDLARIAGKKGGQISRRRKSKLSTTKINYEGTPYAG